MASSSTASSHATPRPALAPGQLRPDAMHATRPRTSIPLDEASIALRVAWSIYLGLGALPPLALIGTVFVMMLFGYDRQGHEVVPLNGVLGMTLFVIGLLWLSITIPAAFYIRRSIWGGQFYDGHGVDPSRYVKGMAVIWVPMVVAGVFGFIALAFTREVSNLFVSVTAFIVFLSMFPNGHAMTRPVGDHDDPGVYEEPK